MASNKREIIEATKGWLSFRFDVKDKGNAIYVLGVKIWHDWPKRILGLFQETYMKKVLEYFNMYKAKPIDTLVVKNHEISWKNCQWTLKKKMARIPYATVVVSLTSAIVCTPSDLAFAIGLLNLF